MAAVAPPQIQVNDAPVLPGLQSSFSNMSMKEEHASQDARATPAAMASGGNTQAQPSNSSNNNPDQNGNVDGKNNQQQNGNNGGEASGQENGRGSGRGRGYRGGGRRRGGRGRGAGPNAGDRQQNGQDNGQAGGASNENDADGDWAAAAEDGIHNNGQQGNGRRRNPRHGRNASNNNNKTGDNNNRGQQGGQQNRVQAPGPSNGARTSWNTVVYKSRIFTSPTHMYEPDQLRMGNRAWTPKNGGFAPPQRQTANPNRIRDFWICGFNAGTTAKEITDRLAERGIVDINYLRVLPPQSNAWWRSIRLSIRQKDVDTLLDANTWEPWICVVPWNWDQEGQPGLGPKRDYGNYGYDDGSYDNGNYHEGNYNNGPGQRRRMASAGQPLP